ncbi:CDK5 regulatory subunit-associated protein 3 [Ischnura elegans]|uniref:CDK5 regulatory subunit-associated protein 3 n=1 Tax=Ischnura elegans TaxID=197161 RepID=UPI001ED8746E|nr:CDK5 regulatory subunit-associated protein 3 [Ischnura elegans]
MEEQLIPIDIHKNKLVDWLISRRHCKREWQDKIINIREKINNAIQDMPVHEGIAELLSGSYINYFHCKKIVEILKETEKDSKNIFGMYGSQRMKDWQEIIKLYERDNVYLIEAANMLIRNINYEVPSLKKQLVKLEQVQLECEKKDADYTKNANSIQSEFNSQCKQLGIEGIKIKRELVACLSSLPKLLNDACKKAKSLKAAQEFYEAFVIFIIGQEHLGGCLPILKYIIEHGNVTTYEWMYGEPPLKIEEPQLDIAFDDEEKVVENNDKIDFGEESIDFSAVDDASKGVPDQIDFGDGGIDWGSVDEAVDWNSVDDVSKQIDLNDIALSESGIVVEETGMAGGVAKQKEAYTILDNPETRYKLMDELLELESFLLIRLSEMSASDTDHLIGLSQMSEAPATLQMQTTGSTSAMLKQTQDVIAAVMDKRVCQLHSIKHSPRYVDQLAYSLKQKLSIMEKMQLSKKALKTKKEEAIKDAIAIQPKLRLIINKTKELQKEIESDISKKYKNRPCNIMGGANTL